jgi:hypothetical protein
MTRFVWGRFELGGIIAGENDVELVIEMEEATGLLANLDGQLVLYLRFTMQIGAGYSAACCERNDFLKESSVFIPTPITQINPSFRSSNLSLAQCWRSRSYISQGAREVEM